MDWFSWLFKTNLDPSLVYEYGLALSRNQLQLQDASNFNHDLLQSMGISIAKHRLEILKLAKKENGSVPKNTTNKLSGVIKKCLKKCLRKVIPHEEVKEKKITPLRHPSEPNWHQGKWKRALVSTNGDKGMHRSRTIAMSGPLDNNGRLMHEKMMRNKVLRFSGPLDGRFSGPVNNKSPILSGVLDEWAHSPIGYQSPYNYDESAMWSALFEDLKPT